MGDTAVFWHLPAAPLCALQLLGVRALGTGHPAAALPGALPGACELPGVRVFALPLGGRTSLFTSAAWCLRLPY